MEPRRQGRLIGRPDLQHGKWLAAATLLMKRDTRILYLGPLHRLTGHQEFLADRDPLIVLAGLVENYQGAVERAAVGPNRKQMETPPIVAEQQAAALIHQASEKRGRDDAPVGRGGDLKRPQRLRTAGGTSGEQ